MKKKTLIIFSFLITMLALAACGPAPEPTLNAGDLANTAVAEAWIAVTLTQAALPTNTATPIPPTPTPLPTVTPFPTLPPLLATIPSATAATNPCNMPPPIDAQGAKVKVKFVNKSKGTATVAFGMETENPDGECGTYSFTFAENQAAVVDVLAGCYWAYAWIAGNEPSTAKSIEMLCFTDPNQIRGLTIGTEVIGFD